MDLSFRNLFTGQPIHSVSTFSQFTLSITCQSASSTSISVSKWHSPQSHQSTLEGPLARWSSYAAHNFTSCAVFDTTTQHVYASLQERNGFITFPLTAASDNTSWNNEPHHFLFKDKLFAFACLPSSRGDGDGDSVFAVSKTGQISFLRVSEASICKQRLLNPLPLDDILAVSTFEHDCLLVVGTRGSQAFVCPIVLENEGPFESVIMTQLVPIRVPEPPTSAISAKSARGNILLGFYFDHNCAAFLYADGTVHILRSQSSAMKVGKKCFGEWKYAHDNDVKAADQLVAAELVHVFRLCATLESNKPSLLASNEKKSDGYSGGIVPLGRDYVAIGYGQYVSIWDLTYFVGHGLIKMSSWVNDICRGPSDATVLIGSESGMHEVSVGGADVLIPLTLGLAMTRNGTCEAIIVRKQSTKDAVPLRSQPVTVTVTKTAAEAGRPVEHLFRGVMNALDTEELRMVRALLSRELTGSAEAVARLTEEYTTHKKQVRRGNRGERTDMGLAKLPSERLAAASVARCLYEIHHGNAKYLVPLIDMLGTGVVSNEAVLTVIGLSDSWNMGPEKEQLNFLSIVDSLLSSEVYCNALEAVVTRVSDLSEPDIVRVVQYINRVMRAEFDETIYAEDEATENPNKDKMVTLFSRGTHLLVKCVTARGERKRLVESLRQIPVADVVSILNRLEQILVCLNTEELKSKTRTTHARRSVREGFFSGNSFNEEDAKTYRGVGDWLDKDDARYKAENKGAEIHGCITWICHLIDAHLTNIIMDASARKLIKRLLRVVKVRQREYMMMKSLQGLSSHLTGQRPVPRLEDPFCSGKMIEVPTFASLE